MQPNVSGTESGPWASAGMESPQVLQPEAGAGWATSVTGTPYPPPRPAPPGAGNTVYSGLSSIRLGPLRALAPPTLSLGPSKEGRGPSGLQERVRGAVGGASTPAPGLWLAPPTRTPPPQSPVLALDLNHGAAPWPGRFGVWMGRELMLQAGPPSLLQNRTALRVGMRELNSFPGKRPGWDRVRCWEPSALARLPGQKPYASWSRRAVPGSDRQAGG